MSQSGCFVDSNVWLYWLADDMKLSTEERLRKRHLAVEVIKNENLVISTQVLNEVCANLIKKAGFGEDYIHQVVQEFYDSCDVIVFNYDILIQASELRGRYNFSFWDSLIVSSALYAKAVILYSEDMQDGIVVSGQLEIVNPFK
ncbi:PIN domain-containing protein [Scytonema sp. UIC 10036]|uniref:PIN domain-containing protein n=1 Tax=Scytonema sp. UIC 10036 TaxID=2304196 RepID=UPI0012DA9F4A|nr:PIN domain-containing protein [Scytonema sp. UIC 10036]MUG93464.1 PIN domain-containing protein [Scytonema sp. UIC 10036]